MRTIPCVFAGLLAACLVSTAAVAQDSYDFQHNANFSAIRTYGFKQTPPASPVEEQTTTYDSAIMRERTEAAIAAQLRGRGLRPAADPDVYIVARRTYYTQYYYYPSAWGPYYWPWPYYGATWLDPSGNVYSQLRGVLTVDVEDAKTGALLWRGVEDKHVHRTSKPDERTRRVTEEVADVFKHFPSVAVATADAR